MNQPAGKVILAIEKIARLSADFARLADEAKEVSDRTEEEIRRRISQEHPQALSRDANDPGTRQRGQEAMMIKLKRDQAFLEAVDGLMELAGAPEAHAKVLNVWDHLRDWSHLETEPVSFPMANPLKGLSNASTSPDEMKRIFLAGLEAQREQMEKAMDQRRERSDRFLTQALEAAKKL